MTKDELITYVEQAKGMMEENHAVPRVLWLSPEAYNIWTREVQDVPQLCDIETDEGVKEWKSLAELGIEIGNLTPVKATEKRIIGGQDCANCELRKAIAIGFDLHWHDEEDCPFTCPKAEEANP